MRMVTVLVFAALCGRIAPANAQERPKDAITLEQMGPHMQYQWQLLLVSTIINAKAHGQSVADLGKSIGRLYAKRWGPDLNPNEFGRAVAIRFNRLGFNAEVLNETAGTFSFRWSGPKPDSFARTYAGWPISVAELEDFVTALNIEVSDEGGVVWRQTTDGSWRVATLTRKQ